ncbi:hypothetical protein, partial [Escherichia coli]|uniref:hypothetical protein n=1 Tax=Escherichia coli TaxID=562 RepID=UPI0035E41DC8
DHQRVVAIPAAFDGKDVMRKLVILAREAGYNIEPDPVRVESPVPAHFAGGLHDQSFENGYESQGRTVQSIGMTRDGGRGQAQGGGGGGARGGGGGGGGGG